MGYCTVADLSHAINASAIASLSTQSLEWAIDAATATMDGYFRARFNAPLTSWGSDTRLVCARLAIWNAMSQRGFRPESGSDATIRMGYEDAIAWLKAVSRQEITPEAAPQAAAPAGGQPFVTSNTPRFGV